MIKPFNVKAGLSVGTSSITTVLDNSGNATLANVTATGNLSFAGTAWTAYTPSWTSSSTTPSIGDGTITGSYTQLGKTVFVKIKVVMGSTTDFGSGSWRFSLPVTAANYDAVLSASLSDNGTAWYAASAFNAYENSTGFVNLVTGTTIVSAIAPFTWTNGDMLTITGSYEAA